MYAPLDSLGPLVKIHSVDFPVSDAQPASRMALASTTHHEFHQCDRVERHEHSPRPRLLLATFSSIPIILQHYHTPQPKSTAPSSTSLSLVAAPTSTQESSNTLTDLKHNYIPYQRAGISYQRRNGSVLRLEDSCPVRVRSLLFFNVGLELTVEPAPNPCPPTENISCNRVPNTIHSAVPWE